MPRMLYSLSACAFVLVLLAVCWLLGLGVLARLGLVDGRSERSLELLLALPLGVGCVFVGLFWLAAAGLLKPPWIVSSFAVLLAVALWWLHRFGGEVFGRLGPMPSAGIAWAARHPFGAAVLGLALATGFLLAMKPPLVWDELMYHLPYAREFANAGGLVVSERLRYPLHSYNLQLLWSAALIFGSEAATHLLNAFFVALTAAGVYVFAHRPFGRSTAIAAAVISLYFGRDLIDTANVDLALTLFVFFSFASLARWQESREDGFLYLSAFLLAMAAGIKYQGLLQVPLFGLALIVAGRAAWAPLLKASALFLLFGSWWYLRNWLVSGDPVHPLGGPVFGFWLWNEADLAIQHRDVARYGHHLPLLLLPALAAIALPGKRTKSEIMLLILGLGGLAAWYLSSRYDRYLLPSVPFLAILSARVLVAAVAGIGASAIGRSLRLPVSGALLTGLRWTGLTLLTLAAAVAVREKLEMICFTSACVDRVYAERTLSHPVRLAVPGFGQMRLYQYGLENEIYLLPEDTAGDWFGRYRYRAVQALQNDPAALAEHLRGLGRDSLLVNRSRAYFDKFPAGAALAPAFETLYDDGRVSLYRITQGP
jgi:hypothetical protein